MWCTNERSWNRIESFPVCTCQVHDDYTVAVHVRYNSWYISLPSSAKQREMTQFCVVWRTWIPMASFFLIFQQSVRKICLKSVRNCPKCPTLHVQNKTFDIFWTNPFLDLTTVNLFTRGWLSLLTSINSTRSAAVWCPVNWWGMLLLYKMVVG